MSKPVCRPVSVTDALTGQRLRIASAEAPHPGRKRGQNRTQPLVRGCQLCIPILGYWHHRQGLTVYVAGTMPAAWRTAAEQGRTQEEVLFQELPAGIHEVNLRDHRADVALLLPLPTTTAADEALAHAA